MHSVAHRRDTSGEAVRVEQEVAVLVLVVPVHTDGAAEVSDEEKVLHHKSDRLSIWNWNVLWWRTRH